MQQRIRAILNIFFIFFLPCFCISNSYPNQLYKAKLIKISDADTFWLKFQGRRIRFDLVGADAPEEFKSRKLRRESGRCHLAQKRIRKLGRIATNYVRSVLSKGDIVHIDIREQNEWGIKGILYLSDGICLNELIVKNGYACVTKGIGEKEESKLYKFFENAKKQKKGLWKEYSKQMDCLCK